MAAAAEGWQYATPLESVGPTTPTATSTFAVTRFTEQGWQFENPVAPITVASVGEDAMPGVQ